MRQTSGSPPETLRVCGVEKSISFASEKQKQEGFAETESALDEALREMGRRLAPLAECGN
jgi:hypothetical protein